MDKDLITDLLERGAVDFSPGSIKWQAVSIPQLTAWLCLDSCRYSAKNILQAPVLWTRKPNKN